MPWFYHEASHITRPEIEAMCQRLLDEARARLGCDFRRVLLLPPDLTRAHSGAGSITETLFNLLPATCDTHVIPTLASTFHTPRVLEQYRKNDDMRDIAHGTSHLIHGSSEGRFIIRYAPGKLTRAEIESVNYAYADVKEALSRYNPATMREGRNTMPDGEEVFFISTPSASLWATCEKLFNRTNHEQLA